nr:Hpt domain-containing protein [Aliikangiella sp. G2MR2-5]
MGDDIDFLLETFAADSRVKIKELSVVIEEKNAEDIRRVAHSIKGSSKNVGAKALADLCETLEQQAREGKLEESNELLAQIVDMLELTLKSLSEQF